MIHGIAPHLSLGRIKLQSSSGHSTMVRGEGGRRWRIRRECKRIRLEEKCRKTCQCDAYSKYTLAGKKRKHLCTRCRNLWNSSKAPHIVWLFIPIHLPSPVLILFCISLPWLSETSAFFPASDNMAEVEPLAYKHLLYIPDYLNAGRRYGGGGSIITKHTKYQGHYNLFSEGG